MVDLQKPRGIKRHRIEGIAAAREAELASYVAAKAPSNKARLRAVEKAAKRRGTIRA